MTTAFVIGNGKSRLDFDLRSISKKGTVFGCNALYRDFADRSVPHFLVAIDDAMITEIECSTFPSTRLIVPPLEERWEPRELWGALRPPRSNTGMNAIKEAIKRNHETVVMIGFDFLLQHEPDSVSNVYDGTMNYGPATRARYSENAARLRYLGWLVVNNPNTQFFLCMPESRVQRGVFTFDLPNFTLATKWARYGVDSAPPSINEVISGKIS